MSLRVNKSTVVFTMVHGKEKGCFPEKMTSRRNLEGAPEALPLATSLIWCIFNLMMLLIC